MRLTIAYSKIKKRNLVLINNATYQRETLSERPIRQPLSTCLPDRGKKDILIFRQLFSFFMGGRHILTKFELQTFDIYVEVFSNIHLWILSMSPDRLRFLRSLCNLLTHLRSCQALTRYKFSIIILGTFHMHEFRNSSLESVAFHIPVTFVDYHQV